MRSSGQSAKRKRLDFSVVEEKRSYSRSEGIYLVYGVQVGKPLEASWVDH
jgi:hypothetical protein